MLDDQVIVQVLQEPDSRSIATSETVNKHQILISISIPVRQQWRITYLDKTVPQTSHHKDLDRPCLRLPLPQKPQRL